MNASGHKLPLLITQKYGRGRTAVFATGGDWRWQMLQPVEDMSHEMFWRQLLRWLVSDTPTRVVASIAAAGALRRRPRASARRGSRHHLSAHQRCASRGAHRGPGWRARKRVDLHPDPLEQGVYSADWDAGQAGSYVAEVTATRGQQELGRDVVTFRREDGVAENFHLEQNRDLLEKLSSQTGGRYYRPNEVSRLGEDISYSDAGITVRETKDLWDMPIVFFLALLLCCTEWVLRRRWGVV